MVKQPDRWHIFLASVFFVLGFSVVFSLLGVLLQGVLASASGAVQLWLGRIGGIVIIVFGLYMTRLWQPSFLGREYKFHLGNKRFKSAHVTSFVFGAAFAVGWTPCVGAILGAILTLAATQPSHAFGLLFAYSLGLGVPFLLVGGFVEKAKHLIKRAGKWVSWVQIIFGIILIIIGILVFTSQLSRVAGLAFASEFLLSLDTSGVIDTVASVNILIAFFAGLVSFLSPCVLPLVPAFLAYLGAIASKGESQ